MKGIPDALEGRGDGNITNGSPTPAASPIPPILQVIGNHDLMFMIFGMLQRSLDTRAVDGGSSSQTTSLGWKKQLHELIFVNESFFEIAVEFLWDTMHSFLSIFSLVPSFKTEDTGYVGLFLYYCFPCMLIVQCRLSITLADLSGVNSSFTPL